MSQSIDQLGRHVSVPVNNDRIISCVPSLTELLFDLGAGDRVVGRTKFCIHPAEKVKNVPLIGGTKNLNIEKILSLNPTLIIGNKEENVKEQIDKLEEEVPVWISDISTMSDNMDMIALLSELLGAQAIGKRMIADMNEKKNRYEAHQPQMQKTVLYLIWHRPIMSVGGDTFIHHMLEIMGLDNVCKAYTRYPELAIDDIKRLQPDYIFLSSEPFPFGQKHLSFFSAHFKDSKLMLVDGELFSWYGSRILRSFDYFEDLKSIM